MLQFELLATDPAKTAAEGSYLGSHARRGVAAACDGPLVGAEVRRVALPQESPRGLRRPERRAVAGVPEGSLVAASVLWRLLERCHHPVLAAPACGGHTSDHLLADAEVCARLEHPGAAVQLVQCAGVRLGEAYRTGDDRGQHDLEIDRRVDRLTDVAERLAVKVEPELRELVRATLGG